MYHCHDHHHDHDNHHHQDNDNHHIKWIELFQIHHDHDYRSIDPGPFSLLGNIIAPKPNALLAGPARADVEDGEGMTPTVKVMTMSMFAGSCVKMETMPMMLKVFNGDR